MFGFGKRKKKREEEARAAAAAAEKARLAEEMRKAEEMKKAELAKKAEAAKKAEEARLAEEAKEAEEAKKVEEAKKAEAKKSAPQKNPVAKKASAKAEDAASVKKAPAKAEEPAKADAPAAPAKKAPAKKATAKAEEPAPASEEISEEAVRSNGKFEIKRTGDGRYMFNVRAGNTQIIASSQVYSSMAACKNGIASIGANAPVAAVEDQTLQTINEEKCPKFQIYFDKAGKYRFNLIATNGNNILSCTQGYRQKSSCKNGIKSVINNAAAPTEILKEEK